MIDVIRERRLAWTPGRYAVFRATFGAYLFVHFAMLVPWAAEVWSRTGVLADAKASPLWMPLNVLVWLDTPWFTTAFVLFAALASAMLAIGHYDRTAAVALWYVFACLLGRNPLIANPGLPFVGWLLLAHAIMPPTAQSDASGLARGAGSTDVREAAWRFPPALWAVAWVVMAVGYTYSGYTKLVSPSWVDGTAFHYLLENPLARDAVFRTWALALPQPFFTVATLGALVLELIYAPLALFRVARPWLWIAMIGMHAGLMLLVDFADLSLGMVMMHLFTFNPAWIEDARARLTRSPDPHASQPGFEQPSTPLLTTPASSILPPAAQKTSTQPSST